MESLLLKKKKKKIPTNQTDRKTHEVDKDEKNNPEGASDSENHQFLYDNQKMSKSTSTKCKTSVKSAEKKD